MGNALINVKRDPSPMGRVEGLGGDSINFRLRGNGVFERTRGRLGDCPSMRMRSFHKSAHHEALCSLGPGVGNLILTRGL